MNVFRNLHFSTPEKLRFLSESYNIPDSRTTDAFSHRLFLPFYFLRNISLVARKEGRCAEKASVGKKFCLETPPGTRKMGRAIGGPAGRPYIGISQVLGKERLARPTQETGSASWFFRATPFLPGRARP
jgi:hypothetical protein